MKMMEEFFFGETPMPKPIKDSSGEKGLLNYLGENNCFLNVVIQSLWHLEAFRQKFTSEKELHKHQEHCVYCSLEVIFTQYAFSEESRLPPTVLRETMAILFRPTMKFQLYELDDAAEAFDAILHCLHSQLVDENSLTAFNQCSDSNCVAHKVFGIDTIEQIKCQSCGAATEPIRSQIRTVYTYSAALRDTYHKDPSLQFCQYLRKASEEDKRPCPNKDECKAQCPIVHYLTGAPEVFTVSIVWDSEESTIFDINTVLKTISMNIDLSNIFVLENKSIATNYRLRGMICYYGKHYIAFFYNHKLNQWYVFDDTNVKAVGREWSDIQDRCVRGKLQPSVLFYERIQEENDDTSVNASTATISPISTIISGTSMVTNMSHFKISTVLPTIIEEEEEEEEKVRISDIVEKTSSSIVPPNMSTTTTKNGMWPRSPEESFIVIPKPTRSEGSGDVDFVVTRTNWLYRRQVRIFRFTDHCFKRIIPASGEEKHIFDYKDVFQVTIVDDHNIIISFYSGKEAQYIQSDEVMALVDLLKAKCKAKGHTFRIVKQ